MSPILSLPTDLQPVPDFDPDRALAKMRYWQATPNRFIKGFLRADLWLKQREIVHSVFSKQRTSVKACHASGKTYVAASIALAILTRFPASQDTVVITTAPTWPQVEKLIWGEIHKQVRGSVYPFPKALSTELKLGPKRYAYGLSTNVEKQDEGVKIQGVHADNVLIIIDEAPGVDPKILEALEAALSSGNAHILEIGNPTIPSGPFADTFGRHRSLWNTFTISAFDTPNLAGLNIEDLLRMEKDDPEELTRSVAPYLISRRWVLDMYRKHGIKGMFYLSRVMGEFPEQSEDSLFSIANLEAARRTIDRESTGYGLIGGLDVAGPGEADTVLVLRDGPNLIHRFATSAADARGPVIAELKKFPKDRISNINVDSAGIGWYMYTHLNEEGWPCTAVNVGEAAKDTEKYDNLKAELYWGLAERVRDGEVGGLCDEQIQQLSTIRYEQTPKGKVKIESKEDMVKRGVPSPDEAEAAMLCFSGTGLDIWERL